MEEQRMLRTVVNRVHPVTGESLIPEQSTEELANASVLDAPTLEARQSALSELDEDDDLAPGQVKRPVHYEPHLVVGEKDGPIRGIFRMDPKHDPNCKPKKSKAGRAKSLAKGTEAGLRRLTSREEARSMITTRKAQIED